MKKDNQPDAGPALEESNTTKASQEEPAEDNEDQAVSKG